MADDVRAAGTSGSIERVGFFAALMAVLLVALPTLPAVFFPSNPIVDALLFVALPYLALILLVAGLTYRAAGWLAPKQLTGLRTVSIVPNVFGRTDVVKNMLKRILGFYTLPKMEGDRTLIVGSMLFHYGIWAVLIGHLAMVVPLGMSPGLHSAVALYLGGVAGSASFVGLLVLAARRVSVPRVRSISYVDDYFAVAILFAVVASGLVQTLFTRPDYMASVAPWLVSLLTFRPELASLSQAGPMTMAHVVITLLFIAYVPLGKMTHVVSYLFMPTIAKSGQRVGDVGIPVEANPVAPGGGHDES